MTTVSPDDVPWTGAFEHKLNSTDDYVTQGISGIIYIALTPFVALFIIVGNGLTIWVVVHYPHMRTLTNYLVVSLSTADLLVGMFSPFYVAIQTVVNSEGQTMAQTNRSACLCCMWAMQMTVTSSVFNLLAIAVERYIAVFFPLRYASLLTKDRLRLSIVLMWTTSVTVSLPPLMGWNRFYADDFSNCGFLDLFPEMHLLLLYVFPVTCCSLTLTGIYIAIFTTAYKQQRRLRLEVLSGQGPPSKREMKITKMLATVVGIFYTCWSPYLLLTLVLLQREDGGPMLLQRVYAYSKYVLVLNSGMNPLIYAYRNREFRNAYRRTFGCNVNDVIDFQSSTSHL